ncbi:MAG: Rieske (2Fe-2S) protein [Gammaproteobacteria bacterium]
MAKKHAVCAVTDLPPGARRITQIGSRSVGVFNVGGEFFALLNICPHKAANLCEGTVCGTNLPVDAARGYTYEYGLENEVLRCARHGWEFKIRTGESLIDPKIRAKTYPVEVADGQVFVVV